MYGLFILDEYVARTHLVRKAVESLFDGTTIVCVPMQLIPENIIDLLFCGRFKREVAILSLSLHSDPNN